MDRFLSQSRGC